MIQWGTPGLLRQRAAGVYAPTPPLPPSGRLSDLDSKPYFRLPLPRTMPEGHREGKAIKCLKCPPQDSSQERPKQPGASFPRLQRPTTQTNPRSAGPSLRTGRPDPAQREPRKPTRGKAFIRKPAAFFPLLLLSPFFEGGGVRTAPRQSCSVLPPAAWVWSRAPRPRTWAFSLS